LVRWHIDTGKKVTGGKIVAHRKKKRYERGSEQLLVRIGETERFVKRTRGGGRKIKAVSVEFANVVNPQTKKTQKVKILSVIENKANPHFVRRGIVTKGAIIKTELGDAIVTSRPSQEGVVNAVLIKTTQ
jgi:small subunit ribosomal protein S8e